MGKFRGLYLGKMLERDGVEYGSNNLIISPPGSGKTYFILNILKKRYAGKKLMLVSTTSLKDSYGNEVGTFTTQDLRRKHLNVTDDDVYIMTYAEFGRKILWKKWREDFMKEYSVIFCDEIHSLLDYYLSHRTPEYAIAINVLFDKYEDITLFYFTATTHKIDKFIDEVYSDLYENVKIIDYGKSREIRQYINITEEKFTSVDDMENVVDKIGKIDIADVKGIIFNERIDGMERIVRSLESTGLKSISIWSVNNDKRKMNDEQLRVREMLLTTGMFPDEYDFVIMNEAMREGWNIYDERVQIVILNTLDETNAIQFRGRVRHDVALMAVRAKEGLQPIDVRIMARERSLKVIEGYLGKEIGKKEKEEIAAKLNIRREKDGRLYKWPKIKEALEANGYEISPPKRKTIDGKKETFHIITRKEDKRPSTDFRARKFIASLDDLGFAKKNEKTLDNYMKKGRGVAFSNIKSSYNNYVINGDWSERKFLDVTYLLARDKELFSEKSYHEYGRYYGTKISEVEILKERSKYEKEATKQLEEIKKAEEKKKIEEEQELLKYIRDHGMGK